MCIAVALAWLRWVEGIALTRWDLIGTVIAMAVIAPCGGEQDPCRRAICGGRNVTGPQTGSGGCDCHWPWFDDRGWHFRGDRPGRAS